jgi:hypothetical protein
MKPIVDRSGRVIAYENDESPNRKRIRSRSAALLATFTPQNGPQGQTTDRSGRVVGSGDQRERFIPQDE